MGDGSGLGFGSALGGMRPMGSDPEALGIGTITATADELVGVGSELIAAPGLTVVAGAKGVVVGPVSAGTGCRVRGGSYATISTSQSL